MHKDVPHAGLAPSRHVHRVLLSLPVDMGGSSAPRSAAVRLAQHGPRLVLAAMPSRADAIEYPHPPTTSAPLHQVGPSSRTTPAAHWQPLHVSQYRCDGWRHANRADAGTAAKKVNPAMLECPEIKGMQGQGGTHAPRPPRRRGAPAAERWIWPEVAPPRAYSAWNCSLHW